MCAYTYGISKVNTLNTLPVQLGDLSIICDHGLFSSEHVLIKGVGITHLGFHTVLDKNR